MVYNNNTLVPSHNNNENPKFHTTKLKIIEDEESSGSLDLVVVLHAQEFQQPSEIISTHTNEQQHQQEYVNNIKNLKANTSSIANLTIGKNSGKQNIFFCLKC